jgi:hypothetical protein
MMRTAAALKELVVSMESCVVLDSTIAGSTRRRVPRALTISTSYKQRYLECYG